MIDFEKKKEEKLKELEEINENIKDILSQNSFIELLSPKEEKSLKEIYQQNSKYIKKLKSDEFEIAIVGLENAGKSSLANALIENDVLPSAPERCTFTSTKLVYGEEDRAIVELYTEEEFNKIFQELLESLKYPNAKSITYEDLSLEEFENYFEKLKETDPNLYALHNSKTDEEIKEILKYSKYLELSGETLTFKGTELNGDTFKSYIKGENIGEDLLEVNTAKPRSVKSISIESSKLKQLKKATIYDVPGFDSPTKIHERQTRERLQKADAIVLVTNVGDRPNLTAPQLDTLRKDSDLDGIPLKDKLFVFGNKIDTANSKEIAINNARILLNELINKYKIGDKKRIFFGSALKYLIEKGIKDGSKEMYNTKFDIPSKVDELRKALEEYYQNERFEILKKKIAKNKNETLDILKDVYYKTKDLEEIDFAKTKKSEILNKIRDKIQNNLENKLREFNEKLKREFEENRYFSNRFREIIEKHGDRYFPLIGEKDIEEASRQIDFSSTSDLGVEALNHYIRMKIVPIFLKNFSDLIINMTEDKSKTIQNDLEEKILEAININNDTFIQNKLKKEIKKVLEKLGLDIFYKQNSFSYLIERFSRNIFDILIAKPLLSEDRKNKFKKAEQEFLYLANFYVGDKSEFINILLTGKRNKVNLEVQEKTVNKALNNIKNRLKDILEQSSGFSSFNPMGTTEIKNEIQKLIKSIEKEEEININNNQIDFDISIDIEKILIGTRRSKTKSEVIEEINNDIENLRLILKDIVTPAVNLEFSFYNTINKNIIFLLDVINDRKNLDKKEYQDFVTFRAVIENLVSEKELKNIHQEIEKNEKKKELLEFIKNFINAN